MHSPSQTVCFIAGAVVIVGLALAIAIPYRYGTYGDTLFSLSHMDTFPLTPDNKKLSTTFCSSFGVETVTPPNETFGLLVYNEEPPLSSQRETDAFQKNLTLLPNEFADYTFYLLKGSEVTLDICSHGGSLYLYVFEWLADFEQWKKDRYCFCWDYYHLFPKCGDDNHTTSHSISFITSGRKYFVFQNNLQPNEVSVAFDMQRVVYDSSYATQVIRSTTSASVGIEVAAKSFITITMAPYSEDYDTKVSDVIHVNAVCNPHIEFYLLVFLSLPVVIGLLAAFMLQCGLKKNHSGRYRGLINDPNSEQQS